MHRYYFQIAVSSKHLQGGPISLKLTNQTAASEHEARRRVIQRALADSWWVRGLELLKSRTLET